MKTVSVNKSEYFKNKKYIHIDRCEYLDYSEIKYHCHDFIEIAYVYNGKGKHVFNDIEYMVTKGDLFVINTDIPHSFYPLDFENTGKLKVMNVIFVSDILENLKSEITLLKEAASVFLDREVYPKMEKNNVDVCFIDKEHIEINKLLDEMYIEYNGKKEGYYEVLKIDLSKLLIKMLRSYKRKKTIGYNKKNDKDKLIDDIIIYLNENYKRKIFLEDIARMFYISKSHLTNIFKSSTGMSVLSYIQKLRIEEACKVLTMGTKKTFTEISQDIGYNNYKFFHKTFKKITGMSPREYKKKNR